MRIDVQWSREASAQLQQLTPQQQADAHRVTETIRSNPQAIKPAYTRPLPNGQEQLVYELFGLLVKVRYIYKTGMFRKLIIWVEEVVPTYLPSIDDYEERTRP